MISKHITLSLSHWPTKYSTEMRADRLVWLETWHPSVFWHQPRAKAFSLASCQSPVMTHQHVSSSTATSAGLISAFNLRIMFIKRRHVCKGVSKGSALTWRDVSGSVSWSIQPWPVSLKSLIRGRPADIGSCTF